MRQIAIKMEWASVYELMDECGMDEQYRAFTKRLEDMYATEFPGINFVIEWTD